MDLLTRHDLKTLLAERQPPCVSIFMPAHRGGAEEDPIRWRTHLAQAEKELSEEGWPKPEIRKLLDPARHLQNASSFWRHQCDGLAAFLAPRFLRLFRVPVAFNDLVVVGHHFAVTPLLPLLAGDGKFFVLALSQNAVRLLQGTRDTVSEIDLDGVPQNYADAMITHDRDEPLTFHARPTSGGTWGAIFEGHGVGIDDKKDDLLRYFQQIDKWLGRLLANEKAPLVLAAVGYLHPIYKKANHYPHLLDAGIDGNPDRMSNLELLDQAWPIVKPLFEATQERAMAQYRRLAGTEHVLTDLDSIVAAAHEGTVETLFLPQGRQVWGVFNAMTGSAERHSQRLRGDANLVDLAVAHTLDHGHDVYVMPASQIPGGGEAAAILCLPLAKHGKRP